MTSRREFLTHTTAAIVAATSAVRDAQAQASTPPRTAGPRIKSVLPREESTLRLGGVGDSFHMSWAGDDRQLVAVEDGVGWFEKPKGFYNSRLWTVSGAPHEATFHDVP